MIGIRTEKNPIWRTMMTKSEISRIGMKNLTYMEQGQLELKVPALCSGRPQSEMS